MRIRIRPFTAATIIALLNVACGGDGTGPAGPAVASISLSFPGSTLSMGATQPLTPEFRDAAGVLLGHVDSVSWSSSNATIASVDQSGNVRGVSLGGPVTITVARKDKSAAVTLSVIPDRLAFTPNVSTLILGSTLQLTAAPFDYFSAPIPTPTGPVTWASSNVSIARVDSSGFVTTVASGDVLISATAAGRTSGLQLEVGVPSTYDGTWAGSSICATCTTPTTYPVTFKVLFGRIRTFVETFAVSTVNPICTSAGGSIVQPAATGTPNATVTNDQFAFSLTTPAAVISGTFTGPATMTGNQSAMSLTIVCSAGAGNLGLLNVAATTFSASKQ